MGKSKTHEEFLQDLNKLQPGKYEVLSEYKDRRTKLKVRYTDCGHENYVIPQSLYKGGGCNKCRPKKTGDKLKSNTEEFKNKLFDKFGGEYELIGDYVSSNDKVLIRHTKCGYEYYIRPDSILRGSKCNKCNHTRYSNMFTKSTSTYAKEVSDLTDGEYSLVSEYLGVKEYVKIKHNKCGCTYNVYPYNFNKGRRCPNCNKSIGEEIVKKVLTDIDLKFEEQVSFEGLIDKSNLTYDFYLPELDLLIEYQGIQHYEPVELFGGEPTLKIQQRHDEIKRQYASSNNIELLEISYKIAKYKDIYKIIKDKIESIA